MAKRAGVYSSDKRRKELKRQKKQEDKKQKRIKSNPNPAQGSEETGSTNSETEASEGTTPETD